MKREREYIIIEIEKITDEMIKKCIETSRDTLRLSLDGKKALLKWAKVDKPSRISSRTEKVFSHSEILEELQKPEWLRNVVSRR